MSIVTPRHDLVGLVIPTHIFQPPSDLKGVSEYRILEAGVRRDDEGCVALHITPVDKPVEGLWLILTIDELSRKVIDPPRR